MRITTSNNEALSQTRLTGESVVTRDNQLRRVELLSIWSAWGVIALILCGTSIMTPLTMPNGTVLEPIIGSLFEVCLWALLTPVIFKLATHLTLDHKQWLLRLALLLAIGVVISVSVFALLSRFRLFEQQVLGQLLHNYRSVDSRKPMDPFTIRLWQYFEYAIFLVVLTAGIAKDYLARYRRYQQQLAQVSVELAHAKLRTLQNQLNPHFLFNTLNAVSSLISSNPKNAQDVIAQLSDLLRETLASKALEVSVSKELELVQRYLDIMQVRYGDRLRFTSTIETGVEQGMVPTFIVQPLIENAIQHGIQMSPGPGTIELAAQKTGQHLSITVINTSPDAEHETDSGFYREGGIGLSNVRDRLERAYGANQSLKAWRTANQTHVRIMLPFHTTAISE
jgi:two-component system, LytTR family, sensor kinase